MADEERLDAAPASKEKRWESDAWRQFKVLSPAKVEAETNDIADTQRAFTWMEVEGENTATARLAADGSQDPDRRDGSVNIAGCVSRRS